MASEGDRVRQTRFHGRTLRDALCDHPGCIEPGEFRAPVEGGRRPGFDGPGDWRWLCLEHVREHNARYNYFSGMSTDEIEEAQRPMAGWERETRAFSAGAGAMPRWGDFNDPIDAIQARYGRSPATEKGRGDGRPLSGDNRKDMRTLGLEIDADRKALRQRYSELVRRYHPDRNGGDRSHEAALQEVIGAYTRLKSAPAFA